MAGVTVIVTVSPREGIENTLKICVLTGTQKTLPPAKGQYSGLSKSAGN